MAKNRYRRNRNRRKRRRSPLRTVRPILFTLAAMILLGALSTVMIFTHDLFTQCDYFKARELTVVGNQRLTPDQVLSKAGLEAGVNILSVNLPLSRKRLRDHPWIDQAQVRRELPHALVVTIREHQPLAVIDVGKRFLINDQGEIFKAFTTQDPQNLPLIKGLNVADLEIPGNRKPTMFKAVMTVLDMGRQKNSVLPNGMISTIRVDREMGLTVEAFGRRKRINIGFEDYPAKYQRLKQVLNYMNRNDDFPDFRWIDLNNVDRIVVHPVRHKET